MALIRERDGARLHIKSKLMGESLVGKELLKSLEYKELFRLFPDVTVVKMGGQSMMDQGAKAILLIAQEIAVNREKHNMIVTTGGGTRSRHAYAIA